MVQQLERYFGRKEQGEPQLSYLVSETMGGMIDPQRIDRIIAKCRDEGFMFHGIKNGEYGQVNDDGILPFTPEGGNVSFWNSGNGLFGFVTWQGTLETLDSTFFNYAHSGNHPERTTMVIAVTKKSEAEKVDPSFVPANDVNTVSTIVPRNSIHLLIVEGFRKGKKIEPRKAGQQTEREMFGLIEQVVAGGYKPGGLHIKEIELG